MNLVNISEVIFFLGIWLVIYVTFYSPKARIRIIKRQIYRIPIKIARAKRERPDATKQLDDMLNKALDIRYRMIIALLEYHFDPEEDKDYIEKIRQQLPFDFKEK